MSFCKRFQTRNLSLGAVKKWKTNWKKVCFVNDSAKLAICTITYQVNLKILKLKMSGYVDKLNNEQ